MRLSDEDIKLWLNEKKLIINPRPKDNCVHGITVDLTLSNRFRTIKNHSIAFINLNASKKNINRTLDKVMSNEIVLKKQKPFFLQPGSFALAMTREELTLPNNLVGWLDGKSSLARLGLMIHATSHRIDPGWKGNIVLEFFNSSNIVLAVYPRMFIAAISFEKLSKPVKTPYNSRVNAKYFGQKNIISSRINQD
ncbi:dCTP deaminase [Buchnera aphidicola (Anoecia corni)]|uniref:dCTP deaminase n=1 Tax=Buchnera aphidicola (Anoecia corni) TaxID=2994477 RepID=A0AAT9IFS1_9GAMM